MKKYYFKLWYLYLFIFIFATIASGLTAYSVLSLGKSIDYVISKETNKLIFALSFSVGGFVLGVSISQFNNYVLRAALSKKLNNSLRQLIAKKINAMSYSEYIKNKKGNYIYWLTNDVNTMEQLVFGSTFEIFEVIPTLIIIGYSYYTMHWMLGVVAFLATCFLILIPYIFAKRKSKIENNLSKLSEELNSESLSLIRGYKEFSYRNKKPLFTKMMQNSYIDFENQKFGQNKLLKTQKWTSNLLSVGSQALLSFLGILFYSISVKDSNSIFAASAGSALSAPAMAYQLFMIGRTTINIFINMYSAKDVSKKFNTKIKNDIENYSPKDLNFENLVINNLSYTISNKQIFKNFNLEIDNKKKYLLVGESGKGKTTLFKIIFGLIENYQGEIKINKELDYKKTDKRDIWNLIAYVPQENIIYNASLRDNLTLFDDSIKDEKLLEIIKQVNLSKLLESISLDTILNNDAKNLSGGEVQRVAIARALVQNKPFMIMDEITASLDFDNRQIIENLVGKLDKTILYISHTTDFNNKNFDKTIQL
ncbi:ABC transporter ATP-binding protein [Spiroplasma gladiatoris]|uniref:ABC transporter ATP-binding protein n=1 Tax=Spiroplasma gladiatoris TaxID=2143 RepID=A0A4P7AIN4_9MOLU|nr:ABC transporter ATP-binding protein [Spiroplasma gladiatoris]QBQ07370.1 ABC transporter ATP-binding protein [Spiroplasma gladiatoris]